MTPRIKKSDREWRAQLSEIEYRVLREKGTERAFSGKYNNEKRTGTYMCRGCGASLFASETKYDSGSGWPSFYDVLDDANVRTKSDKELLMMRTEVICAVCDGHLGHVFSDALSLLACVIASIRLRLIWMTDLAVKTLSSWL